MSSFPSDVTTLLFDLDGTLVEPRRGIVGCVRRTLAELGCPAGPDEALDWVIGPPIRASFARLLDGRADTEAAVALYRRLYAGGGLTEAEVYPGIEAALAELGRSRRLVVCTSKARVFATRVLEHFGLAGCFAAVYGAELDGRFDDKGELIAHLLAEEGLAPEQALMIGDREFDILGAARNGVAAVGVLWGHGDAAELTAAGAARLCQAPGDLAAICLGPAA